MNNMQPLTEADLEFINKIIGRGGVNSTILKEVEANNLQECAAVAYSTDKEEKFSHVVLQIREGNNNLLFIGVTKRITYNDKIDHHNEETAFNIALSRALRAEAITL